MYNSRNFSFKGTLFYCYLLYVEKIKSIWTHFRLSIETGRKESKKNMYLLTAINLNKIFYEQMFKRLHKIYK